MVLICTDADSGRLTKPHSQQRGSNVSQLQQTLMSNPYSPSYTGGPSRMFPDASSLTAPTSETSPISLPSKPRNLTAELQGSLMRWTPPWLAQEKPLDQRAAENGQADLLTTNPAREKEFVPAATAHELQSKPSSPKMNCVSHALRKPRYGPHLRPEDI